MISILLGLINPLVSIGTEIAKYKTASLNATTDQARIAADERVKGLEAKRDVLVAESGQRINAFIRAAFALPFVIYNFKLVVWDKVFNLGSTDKLSTELFQIELACIGFYFVYDIIARLRR